LTDTDATPHVCRQGRPDLLHRPPRPGRRDRRRQTRAQDLCQRDLFKAGQCLGRTLVCVVKSGNVSSTIKTLEPIDQARGKKQPTIRKFLQGSNESLRVFKVRPTGLPPGFEAKCMVVVLSG
jgi:hypothetical protein